MRIFRSTLGKAFAVLVLITLLFTLFPTLSAGPVQAQGAAIHHYVVTPSSSAMTAGLSGGIVFDSKKDGNYEIYVMNADGSAPVRLTNNAADDWRPARSPDGSKIAFMSDRDGSGYEIYVMNADGTGQTRLTNNILWDGFPAWSPDGSKIAFESKRDGNAEIYVMNADGSGQTRITNNTADDWDPAWSPDGSRMAFVSERDGNGEIYVMNADGSGQTRITNNTADDWEPAWSPDGSRIAFVSERDGNAEIYVMNADGSAQTRLTNNTAENWDPTWSPDGRKIIFDSNRDGNWEIYVMNPDGSGQTRLTNNSVVDEYPDWWGFAVTITAVDASGNVVTADSSTQVTLTSSSATMKFDGDGDGTYGEAGDNVRTLANGTFIISAGDATVATGVTITATDSSSKTGTTSAITVIPGSLHHYVLTPSSSAMTAGSGSVVAMRVNAFGMMGIFKLDLNYEELGWMSLDVDWEGEPAWSPNGAKIAFVSLRDGNEEIYVVNADRTGLARLTSNGVGLEGFLGYGGADDNEPAWSPDSTRIAFVSDRDGNREIYVMNANGSGQTRLTNNTATDYDPSWSPDGAKIAFVSSRDGNREVYVMNADGSGQTRLTNNTAWDYYPVWSPDGAKIAFVSRRDGNDEIYVMNANGTGLTRLTSDSGEDCHLAWSPDGTKIAFCSDRDGNHEIYVMNANGSGPTRLTNNTAWDYEPSWSPDGTKIAFLSDRDGLDGVYVMSANGSGQARITSSSGEDYDPFVWSPDGTKIAFASARDDFDFSRVYVINVNGTGEAMLTPAASGDQSPSWSPDGRKIALSSDRDHGWSPWAASQTVRHTDIYTINGDGTGRARLTNDTALRNDDPTWSPDGTKIVFTSRASGDTDSGDEVWVMNADGSGKAALTANSSHDGQPHFSPDGTKIAFESSRDGNREIYVMNANGSSPSRLTTNSAADEHPRWSPDGTKITFSSNRDGNWEIYVMGANGAGQTRLTTDPAADTTPSWSPDGSHIVFTSARDGADGIYVMTASGGGQAALFAEDPVTLREPSWTAFTFTVTAVDASGNVLTADSLTQVTLTSSSSSMGFDADGDGSFDEADNVKTLTAGRLIIAATAYEVASGATVTAAEAGGKTGSVTVAVNPGFIAGYELSAPLRPEVLVPFNITIQAYDYYNNAVEVGTDSSTRVTLEADSPYLKFDGNGNGAFGEPNDSIAVLRNGEATVGAKFTRLASDVEIYVHDVYYRGGWDYIDEVIPQLGQVASLRVEGASPMAAGSSQQLTISARDSAGNIVTSYAGDKALTFSGLSSVGSYTPKVTDKSGTAVSIGSPTTITFTAGVSTAGGLLTAYRAGSATLGVSDGTASSAWTSGASLSLTVSAGTAQSYLVTKSSYTDTGAVAAGTTFGVVVRAADQYGNEITSPPSAQVTFTSSSPTMVFDGDGDGTFGEAGDNVKAFPPVYYWQELIDARDTQPGSGVTITATGAGGLTGTTAPFAVIATGPSAVVDLTLTGTATLTAGSPGQLLMAARNEDGDLVTGYTGDKTFTFTGPASSGGSTPTVTDKNGAPVAMGSPTVITFTNGVSTAGGQFTLYKAGSTSITAREGEATGYLSAVRVLPSGLHHYSVTVPAPSAGLSGLPAGAAFIATVTALDQYGNTVTGDSTTRVTLVSTAPGLKFDGNGNGSWGEPGDNVVTLSAGVATPGARDLGSATNVTVAATDAAGKTGASSAFNIINTSPSASLRVTGSATMTAGASQQLTITAYDSGGNVATSFTGDQTLSFDSTPWPSGQFPPSTVTDKSGSDVEFGQPTTITFTNGVSTAGGLLKDYKAGTFTIRASSSGMGQGQGLAVTVQPAAVDRYTVTLSSDRHNVSAAFSVSATAYDAYGNAASNNSSAQVTFTSSSATMQFDGDGDGAFGEAGDNVKTLSSGQAAIQARDTAAASGVTITATSAGGKTGTSSGISIVSAGTAVRLSIAGSASMAAGSSLQLTITARDSAGNVAASYTGDKTLTFSGPSSPTITGKNGAPVVAGSPTTITFTNGVSTAGGLFQSDFAESVTLAVSDGTISSSTGFALSINPGPIVGYQLSTYGLSSILTNQAFTVRVTALDAFGNRVTTDSSTQVTLSSSSGTVKFDGNGNGAFGEPGDNVKRLTAGQFDVPAKGVTPGTGITVTAADAGGKTGAVVDSLSFYASATPAGLWVSMSGADYDSLTAGSPVQLTVTAKDAGYILAASYTGDKTVTFTGMQSIGSFAPTVTDKTGAQVAFGQPTTITFTNGVSTAGGLLRAYKAGAVTVSASDGVLGSPSGSTLSLTVQPAAVDHYTVLTAAPAFNVSTAFPVTVRGLDAYGNTVNNSAATQVTLSSTSSTLVFDGNGNGAFGEAGDNVKSLGSSGQFTIQAKDIAAASGVTVTATSAGGKTGVSAGLTFAGVAAAVRLALTAANASMVAGTSQQVVISAVDSAGNPDVSYSGDKAITFVGPSVEGPFPPTVTDKNGAPVVAGSPTTITFTNGVSTAGGLLTAYTSGYHQGYITDGSLSTPPLAVLVTPAALHHYTLQVPQLPPGAGAAFTVAASALDAYGNTVSNASSTQVTFTSSSATMKFDGNGNGTFGEAGDNVKALGSGQFTIPAKDTAAASGVTITATDAAGKTGTISGITFAGLTAIRLAVTPSSVSIAAGATQQLTITAYDGNGAVATTYTGDKVLTFSGPSAIGASAPTVTDKTGAAVAVGSPTTITFTNGVSTAGGLLRAYKVETATVNAGDGAISSQAGPALSLTVTPGAIAGYAVTSSAYSYGVNTVFSVAVSALDAYGNVVTNNSSTSVTLTSSSGAVKFDGNGNGSYGEPTDHVRVLSAGIVILNAKTMVAGAGVTITVTDAGGKTGTSAAFTFTGS